MKVKYFSEEIEIFDVWGMDNKEFERLFPGVRGKRSDSFTKLVGHKEPANRKSPLLPMTRRIEYKSNPSLHKCDSRCQHAKGHSCECSCGGKNHGIHR
jgi:hypothetical protein